MALYVLEERVIPRMLTPPSETNRRSLPPQLTKRKAHRVLNVDTVAKALMSYHATGDWKEALGACLPKRHASQTSKAERRKARWAAAAAAAAAAEEEEGGRDEWRERNGKGARIG